MLGIIVVAIVGMLAVAVISVTEDGGDARAASGRSLSPQSATALAPLSGSAKPDSAGGVLNSLDLTTCTDSSVLGGRAVEHEGEGSVDVDHSVVYGDYRCSARFTLDAGGKRVELRDGTEQLAGQVRYYAITLRLDPSWPTGKDAPDTVITQFLNVDTDRNFAPPLQLTIQGGDFHMWSYGTYSGQINPERAARYTLLWDHPIETGQWLTFVMGIRWSNDPSAGQFNMTYQGKVVVPTTTLQTLYSNPDGSPCQVYAKAGVYGATGDVTRSMNVGRWQIGASAAAALKG